MGSTFKAKYYSIDKIPCNLVDKNHIKPTTFKQNLSQPQPKIDQIG